MNRKNRKLKLGKLKCISVFYFLFSAFAFGQTHTMTGYNVIPGGSTLTISSGGTITAAAGSTVTGFGGAVSLTATTPIIITPSPTTGTGVISLNATSKSNWDTAFTQMLQWDGGATNLVAATARTSLSLVPGTNVEVPLTFSTGLTRTTNTVTVNTSQNIATLSNLTTNGFVKTGGAVGTLSVDTATYQPSDADLTLWAAITPVAAVGTWIATPSSANLRLAMTDENGTGALLFSGATTPDFTTGFTIGAAAASGKILIGNGTNYVPSTPTYPNAASPTALKWLRADGTNWIASTATLAEGAVTAGKMLQSDATNWVASTPTWPTTAGTVGYTVRSDGTNFASYPQDQLNSSVASQATFSTADIYIAGSNVTVAAGDFKAKGQYHCVFDMTKSAGTGAIVISVRAGTNGTTADTAQLTFTFGAGTSIADTGVFDIWVTWRTVGSGTSAVIQGVCRAQKNAATTTGLWNNAGTDLVIVAATSSGFASNTFTNIGLSFNGSTAFAGTGTLVQATLVQ